MRRRAGIIERLTGEACFRVLVGGIYAFLLAPVLITFLAAISSGSTLSFPPKGISLRWFGAFLGDDAWRESYRISLITSLVAAGLALVSGSLFAYAHLRFRFRGRGVASAVAVSPLALPRIILGVALLLYLKPFGMVGSLSGLVLGLSVVASPFVVRTVGAVLGTYDRAIEEAALTLGADEIQTFFRVTLPLIRPGLVSAAILAFIYSFGNLQVAIFLVGPDTVTIPVRMFSALEFSEDPTIAAVAAVNILIVMAVLFLANRFVGAKTLVRL